MNVISLKNIKKSYGEDESRIDVIKGISLDIEEGDFIAIMGKSGSGKSTLLNILAGLDSYDDGEYSYKGVLINSKDYNKLADFRNKELGFIVQNFALIDDYTIFDNIALPLRYNKVNRNLIDNEVKSVTKILEIEDKLKKYPNQLSGGQCQRVAIARAIIKKPSLILADEPTGALDENTSSGIMEVLKKLNNQGNTIVVVTHDEKVAKECKKIIIMHDGILINRGD